MASKYNLSLRGVQPYLGFDGGMYLLRSETGTPSTEYGVAPKVGFRLPITTGVDVDLNTTYEVVLQESTNITYVGLDVGIAYIFGR